ncbi:MAG: M61 family metallopeptidase [Sphingomonadales bacterium]|nr:M61 family metallopeptidase [Sphingomonadales bacterium]
MVMKYAAPTIFAYLKALQALIVCGVWGCCPPATKVGLYSYPFLRSTGFEISERHQGLDNSVPTNHLLANHASASHLPANLSSMNLSSMNHLSMNHASANHASASHLPANHLSVSHIPAHRVPVNPEDEVVPVQYSLRIPQPSARYAEIEMLIDTRTKDTVELGLPVWAPGSYMIREFTRNVDRFQATDAESGRQLSWWKCRKNAWQVSTGGVERIQVRYRVYANEFSVRTSYIDQDQAALLGSSVFMWVEGQQSRPHILCISLPQAWKQAATALVPVATETKQPTFRAAHYDELVDCPIQMGNFPEFTFEAEGIPHRVVMPGAGKFPRNKLEQDMKAIVESCTEIFDHQPNLNYLFIIQHAAKGGGGLEHANSTTLQTREDVYNQPERYTDFLGLVAHEYFHLWNVKRLRPEALNPFDYNREVYTHHLWFAEGITSYYDNLILRRAGLLSTDKYQKTLLDGFNAVLGNRGDLEQSLAESSYDAWIKFYLRNENSGNTTVSYYRKGAMLGFVCDAALWHRSGGEFGLDSVMKWMYGRFALQEQRGFTDNEIRDAFRMHLGSEADSLWDRYVYGREAVDFARYANYAGLILKDTQDYMRKAYFGAAGNRNPDGWVVTSLWEGSTAWKMGIQTGDVLMKCAGKEPESDWIRDLKPGDVLKVEGKRDGKKIEFKGILESAPFPRFMWLRDPAVNPLQKKVYERLFQEAF